MKVLIINMARSTDRLAFQTAQMQALGMDWERIGAVTPDTLTPPADDPVWTRWQRPLRVTEMALMASHWAAWERVLTLNESCLILEDDAVLASDLPDFLSRIAARDDIDHLTLETRGRKKMVGRTLHAPGIRRLVQDRTGSAAYVLFPSGARKLLQRTRRQPAPSDAAISGTYALRSYQADPALSVQLDFCEYYDLPCPMPAPSTIDAVKKPPNATPAQRRRRIMAQIVMGLRMIAHLPVARRAHVRPAQHWPGITLK